MIKLEVKKGLPRTCQCCLSTEDVSHLIFERPLPNGTSSTLIALCAACRKELLGVMCEDEDR